MNRDFWKGRRVFLTGHTGFKGGWLALWLADMGAEVHGYALSPPTDPSFFIENRLAMRLAGNVRGDIRDHQLLMASMSAAAPEIVIHMAAQPLVRAAYREPTETYSVNVMGTVHLLESVRTTPSVKAVINVTTDKCYENHEWIHPYREDESLGGSDPYSGSKACSELVTASYRRSFLKAVGVGVATARAGNVIGGGDWAEDRLLPDVFRAHGGKQELLIRSPEAIRPWQHVLEPLSGYLTLAEKLFHHGSEYAEAWNFGPDGADEKPVRWIVDYLCERLPGAVWRCDTGDQPHEAGVLRLDNSKAGARLGWHPRWSLQDALQKTLDWHREWKSGQDAASYSLGQIHAYESGT